MLVACAVLGLVAGWSVRPLSLRLGFAEPTVPLVSIAALAFVAAALGYAAHATRRVVRRERPRLGHQHAVNRLVLAKACALVGTLVASGYLGFALGQLGVGEPAAEARLWRGLAAGLAGAAVSGAALLLEHACRVPPGSD